MRRTAAILSALLVLAGCTLPGSNQPSAPPSQQSAPPATATPTTPPSASATTAPELPVIASRSISFSGTPATVSLNEVVVRNGVTNITWSVRNDRATGGTATLGIQLVADLFGDGKRATVPGTNDEVPDDAYYVDGVYLLDTVNRLRYLPARDAEGTCVCTYAPSSIFIRPGDSQSFDAVFKALPDGVTTIDVVIPRAGTFRSVPVQR